MIVLRAARLAIIALGLATASASAQTNDPAVPAGRDPGGRPIAVIGPGLDYTDPVIAGRLARDGEGELIGHDVIDDDRWPFALGDDAKILSAFLGDSQTGTLIPVRADLGSREQLAVAIDFAVKTPARIVLIYGARVAQTFRPMLRAASTLYTDRLFVVAAGDSGIDLDVTTSAADFDLTNVIVVTAVGAQGVSDGQSNTGARAVDVAVALDGTAAGHSAAAAAAVTALLVRLDAVDPGLSPAEAKRRVLELAMPWPAGATPLAKAGWISNIRRPFWLE